MAARKKTDTAPANDTTTPTPTPTLAPRVLAEGCNLACEYRNVTDVPTLVTNWDAKWGDKPSPGERYAALDLCARHRGEIDGRIADERARVGRVVA